MGVQEFLRSPADGYTLLMPDSSQWAVLPALRSELPYETLRDFAPVGLVFTSTLFIVALDTFSANNLGELITLARANPGSLHIGSIGTSGLLSIFAATFRASLGLDMTYVPYKGGADLVAALLRGEVPVAVISTASISPFVKSGKMRLLAAGSKVRAKFAPDVPTIAEAAGLPDFDFAGQMGMVTRSGTPQPIIDKLSAILNNASLQPEVVSKAAAIGIDMTPTSPAQLADLMRNDLKKFAQAIKISGIKVD